ncbi:MAG: phage/plasmid primase, P4 family [Spirochaetales bacterium]|uniref:Phage/plasmid primase, P4 family n=1 Tax=Candidatus Thalassospirochaeta sargassi TaxID=3119039 RepID=A0AAJ1IBW2_9SPIO|nr:phage/plasmid primase, P4 family [Spirochaetales bacterium]
MAEKRNVKKLVKVLARFENWETRNAEQLISKNKAQELDVSNNAIEAAHQIAGIQRMKKQEVLSELYLEYLSFSKEIDEQYQKSVDGTILRFERYHERLKGIKDNPVILKPAVNLEREAIYVIAERNVSDDKLFDDTYNAKQLLADYEGLIKYCAAWKKWIIWDGCRWLKDEQDDIYQLAMDSIDKMHEKGKHLKDADEAIMLIEHAGRSKTNRKIDAMVKTAAWMKKAKIQPKKLDTLNMIFNCKNGSIDLRSARLLKHNPEDFITRISPVEFDEQADCPIWIKFLDSIFKRNSSLISFVQKVVGMSLSGDVSAQAMFILYGTGANGKSTFINIIMEIMGDYGANTPTETFMQKKGDGPSNDIARLKGTRFVSAMEAEYGNKLAEAVVKRLTGDDKISARFLYGEYFDFVPTFKIFMATNHKPKVSGMDDAIWRRLKLIPFEVTFNEKQRDPKLGSKLREELPGILNWMVEGCILWQKEGLGNPPIIDKANKDYRNDMSALESFLQECCKRDQQGLVKSSVLYAAYKLWSEENNEHLMSNRTFGMRLAEAGFDKVRQNNGVHWMYITLLK